MEKWKKATVELLSRLIVGEADDPSIAPYRPSKTVAMPRDDKRFFKRARPEKHGISSLRLYSMLSELEANCHANIHSLMVLCDGEVISECSRDGYGVNIAHLSHSMSKTVTGDRKSVV